jgi:hypothetical protein
MQISIEIQAPERQNVNEPRTCRGCLQRVVSRLRTYCYLDPEQDMTPTYALPPKNWTLE